MKRIAYVTGSRADYGIVRKYLGFLDENADIDLEILVTGSLLEDKYGRAVDLIESDGFKIGAKINIQQPDNGIMSTIKSMSASLEGFGDYFYNNKYDLIIILGDRYEMMGVAIAAAMQKIPILHIHGGEVTYGNYDEFIRHSITKMSSYHFTSTEEYRKRVIQLGENPETVYNIGAMGSENCTVIDEKNIPDDIRRHLDKEYFVVLFHPETLTKTNPKMQTEILLQALSEYKKDYDIIFIGSNADTGSEDIRNTVKSFVEKNVNCFYYENLYPDAYHYLLKNSVALIGNSSSGIIEAPTLGVCTVNIGDRQKGRIRGNSVFDTECSVKGIQAAINMVINKDKAVRIENPYFKPQAARKAYEYTLKILDNSYRIKEFYDVDISLS